MKDYCDSSRVPIETLMDDLRALKTQAQIARARARAIRQQTRAILESRASIVQFAEGQNPVRHGWGTIGS